MDHRHDRDVVVELSDRSGPGTVADRLHDRSFVIEKVAGIGPDRHLKRPEIDGVPVAVP